MTRKKIQEELNKIRKSISKIKLPLSEKDRPLYFSLVNQETSLLKQYVKAPIE